MHNKERAEPVLGDSSRCDAKKAAKIERKALFERQKTGNQQQIKDLLWSDPGYVEEPCLIV